MKIYYKMLGLMLVPSFLLGMQTPPRPTQGQNLAVQTAPATPVVQRIDTSPAQSPRTPRTPTRRISLTPPPSPVRMSPRLQAQQRVLYWQDLFRRVMGFVGHDQHQQAEVLMREAFHQVQSPYSGATYQGNNIFHILALINSVDLCHEITAQLNDHLTRTGLEQEDFSARCNGTHGTPLHIAIDNGNLDMIDWLIENRADINAQCFLFEHRNCVCKLPPLHYAIHQQASEEIFERLLIEGADVTVESTDHNYDTPLHVAFRCPPTSLTAFFLRCLALVEPDMDQENWAGNRPLHVAAMGQTSLHAENLRLFLEVMHNRDLYLGQRNNDQRNPSTSLEVALDNNTRSLRHLRAARRWPVHQYLRYQRLVNQRGQRHSPY